MIVHLERNSANALILVKHQDKFKSLKFECGDYKSIFSCSHSFQRGKKCDKLLFLVHLNLSDQGGFKMFRQNYKSYVMRP